MQAERFSIVPCYFDGEVSCILSQGKYTDKNQSGMFYIKTAGAQVNNYGFDNHACQYSHPYGGWS